MSAEAMEAENIGDVAKDIANTTGKDTASGTKNTIDATKQNNTAVKST